MLDLRHSLKGWPTVFVSSMNIHSGIVLLVAKLNTLCLAQTSRLYQIYRI